MKHHRVCLFENLRIPWLPAPSVPAAVITAENTAPSRRNGAFSVVCSLAEGCYGRG